MSTPAERFATYEDLCQVPDTKVAQIIHGQLIVLPRPAPKHALASSSLGDELVDPDLRTLEVFALHGNRWQLEDAFKADDRVCAPPFQAITFNLGGLWP